MISDVTDAGLKVWSVGYTVKEEGSKSGIQEARVLIAVLQVQQLKGVVLQHGVIVKGLTIDNVSRTERREGRFYRWN